MAIEIKYDGVDLKKYLSGLPPGIENAVARGFAKIGSLIKRGGKQRAPVDTGRLRASIFTRSGALFTTVSTNVNYAAYVHEGTSPHFPPPGALEGWARKHGFGKGGGFLVVRAISRRGTRARPFLREAAEEVVREAADIFVGEIKKALK
jgi:HK97 gp10 family phage protein